MPKYTPSLKEDKEFNPLAERIENIAKARHAVVDEINEKFKELKKLSEMLGYNITIRYTEEGIDVNLLKLKVNDTIMVSYI